MHTVDTRNDNRDSMFLLAQIRVKASGEPLNAKVRNLSEGGMMAEGKLRLSRGDTVEVDLRNVGTVEGSVAWVQGERFGISFAEPVDAQAVRAPSADNAAPGTSYVPRQPAISAPKFEPGKIRSI